MLSTQLSRSFIGATSFQGKRLFSSAALVKFHSASPLFLKKKSDKKYYPHCYQVFFLEQYPVLKAEHSDVSQKDLYRLIGKTWKNLSEKQKNVYRDRAAEGKKKLQAEEAAEAAEEAK
ncbi:HMG-box domain-containing protein ASCRUDRAFT_69611 [Ascoidea rubescens DSM 1968]|uniref:HMG box domain-containing protein n=1 Tax=Ascoidea rubescens DSM 1968 TaxID=1344418 RepID=A0A1D2VJV1_9ASCO|nr:hypothetical protein ASCRUDRAFT_69611 [Ascoidea rubescens DSM 1968]ODV61895.1 hypothetical protein ASCRUDRAFT_69611 [Ascoidea rubescens DSM 1968]